MSFWKIFVAFPPNDCQVWVSYVFNIDGPDCLLRNDEKSGKTIDVPL